MPWRPYLHCLILRALREPVLIGRMQKSFPMREANRGRRQCRWRCIQVGKFEDCGWSFGCFREGERAELELEGWVGVRL